MIDARAVLRWCLCGAMGVPAAMLMVSSLGEPGPHAAITFAIGTIELAGAALAIPARTRRFGGALLLASLALATVFHGLRRETPPLFFVVYAPAAWLVTLRREPAAPPPAPGHRASAP